MATTSIWSSVSEAAKYQSARPGHPSKIVTKVLDFLKEGYKGPLTRALDVGCGSGLSTINLVPHFSSVLGTDLSEAMIQQARQTHSQPGLEFLTGGADSLPCPDGSVQVVMVGRAIHYFNQETFFKEVDRVLSPGGVLAYYSVHFPTVLNPAIDKLWWEVLDSEELRPHWPVNPGDGHIIGARNRRDYYVHTIKSPYPDKRIDESVSYDRPLSLATLAAELDTYSAAVRFRAECSNTSSSLVSTFLPRALKALGTADPGVEMATRNSFFIVMVKKPSE